MLNYNIFLQDKLSLSAYVFLAMAILSIWYKRSTFIQATLLTLTIATGFLAHRILATGLIPIVILASFTFLTFNSKKYLTRVAFGVGSLIIAMALFFHLVPGFNNLEVVHNIKLTPNSIPYSFYLNFDKSLIGFFIMWFGFPFINTISFSQLTLRQTLLIASIAVVTLSILVLWVNYVEFAPKWPNIFYIWGLNNLIFACVSEEAIFRGLIQQSLTKLLIRVNHGKIIALVIASVLFGITHFPGGIIYVMLCTVAGLFYGLAYLITGRIESSIITHFLVNMAHFIFFSYPALQHSIVK